GRRIPRPRLWCYGFTICSSASSPAAQSSTAYEFCLVHAKLFGETQIAKRLCELKEAAAEQLRERKKRKET
ncbi:MAG: hypothetical protein LBK41_01365, partial [Clostridiales bacterium]|nr:hypothetical protein [Clostridiales bacterium]